MVLKAPKSPLVLSEIELPKPNLSQVLIEVKTCGVCRTDLHIVDGDLKEPKLPLIPGHQIVGLVKEGTNRWKKGERVGVPWLGGSCQHCFFCSHNMENLCDNALYTGYTLNGGYAEYAVADENYLFSLPKNYSDEAAAPLLCAGLIGYRSFRKLASAETIGFYGFGASASLICQVATFLGKKIYAFTREGDTEGQTLAKKLGAVWAGSSTEKPPVPLDGAIIFAPVGPLVPEALQAIRKGGTVVLAGIHMSTIPAMPYEILWGERTLTSVANLTRQDGLDFLELASRFTIDTSPHIYPLEKANEALSAIRDGTAKGCLVLKI